MRTKLINSVSRHWTRTNYTNSVAGRWKPSHLTDLSWLIFSPYRVRQIKVTNSVVRDWASTYLSNSVARRWTRTILTESVVRRWMPAYSCTWLIRSFDIGRQISIQLKQWLHVLRKNSANFPFSLSNFTKTVIWQLKVSRPACSDSSSST